MKDCARPLDCTWYIDDRAELRCPEHSLVGMVVRGRGLTGNTIPDDPAIRRGIAT